VRAVLLDEWCIRDSHQPIIDQTNTRSYTDITVMTSNGRTGRAISLRASASLTAAVMTCRSGRQKTAHFGYHLIVLNDTALTHSEVRLDPFGSAELTAGQ